MRRAPLLLLLLLMALPAACRSGKRSRCERVCDRAAQCAREQHDEHNDEGECVEQCGKLEREPNLAKAVDEHVACVDGAKDCGAVLRCP